MKKASNELSQRKRNCNWYIEILAGDDKIMGEQMYTINEITDGVVVTRYHYAEIKITKKGYTVKYVDLFSEAREAYLTPKEWIIE